MGSLSSLGLENTKHLDTNKDINKKKAKSYKEKGTKRSLSVFLGRSGEVEGEAGAGEEVPDEGEAGAGEEVADEGEEADDDDVPFPSFFLFLPFFEVVNSSSR